MITIKSEKEIEKMTEAARVWKIVLKAIEENIKEGVTTLELDKIAEKTIRANGATPSFQGEDNGYGNKFKWSICASVNDEIIHGIPNNNKLKNGDVLCLDMGVYKNGYHADAGRTYIVGGDKYATENVKKLVKVTRDAFFEGIKYAKEGYRVGDISNAIEQYITKNGFTILEGYQGHGVGKEMHEDPGVPNYGNKGTGPRLKAGMALAIEPMVCEGKNDVYTKKDHWTVATIDGKMTAYYENTLIITKNDPILLTY